MNKEATKIIVSNFITTHKGRGSKKIISRSKTKKIIAIKKKCREKGARAFKNESKPHSNLVKLLRLRANFIIIKNPSPISINGINSRIIK